MSKMNKSTFRYHHWLALALVVFSFFMSALVSRTVFERLPHLEDEVAYLFQAETLARGQAVIESPDPARAFWKPFVIDRDGKRFGKYPLGWPGTLAIGVALGQTWLVNAWLGALTVALVYRLGREIYGVDTGVLAAALMACSPMALLLNGTVMGHTAALFTTVLFMYAYWRLERGDRNPHPPALRTSPPGPLSVYREGEGSSDRISCLTYGKPLWAAVAGLALGLTIINRPLAGVALAVPFMAWSGVRLVNSYRLTVNGYRSTDASHTLEVTSDELQLGDEKRAALSTQHSALGTRYSLLSTLKPLLAVAVITLAISAVIPLYQYLATGDARQNLYLLVWPYDRAGFGEGYGRNIHTLEKGLRQTGWDLSLTAADVFGWQTENMFGSDGRIRPELEDHLLNAGDYWPPVGLSWVLLPLGLLLGLGRRGWWWALWLAAGGVLLVVTKNQPQTTLRDPTFAYLWMAGGTLWLLLPFGFLVGVRHYPHPPAPSPLRREGEINTSYARRVFAVDSQVAWTWLLLAIPLFLVGLHVAYWIGSQRYSTRYYYEGLAGVALVSAIPLGWLARRVGRWPVYGAVAAALVVSLYGYSTPRISALYRFNWVSPELAEAVERRRSDEGPVLVLVNGTDVRWRSFGRLMVGSSPFLDSDIVAAWDNGAAGVREAILAQFAGRQVIEMEAQGNLGCFTDVQPHECYGEGAAQG